MAHPIFCTRNRLPLLRAIVLFEGATDVPGVITWDELLKIGSSVSILHTITGHMHC